MNQKKMYNELTKLINEKATVVKESVAKELLEIFESGEVEDKLFARTLDVFDNIWGFDWYSQCDFGIDYCYLYDVLEDTKSLIPKDKFKNLIGYLQYSLDDNGETDEFLERHKGERLKGTIWEMLKETSGESAGSIGIEDVVEWVMDEVSQETSNLLLVKIGNDRERAFQFAGWIKGILVDAEEEERKSGKNFYIDFEGRQF